MAEVRSTDIVAIEACLANAEELLRGAEVLLEKASARLAYHLGVLALEELGKSRILQMKIVSDVAGQEMPASITRALDDHIRKLFWAIWGPSMGHAMISVRQIDENLGLATRLHEKRISGLYVDRLDTGEVALPTGAITDQETIDLLRFVRAAFELAKADLVDRDALGQADAQERIRWFFEITDDEERRRFIFSRTSMEKLKELGTVPKWADWLKEKFAESEAAAKAALDAELQRQPDAKDNARPRWRFTLRIYSTSHSIRQKVLNDTNSGLKWISLRNVSGKSDQLLIDLEAWSDIPLEALWSNQLFLARLVVMALNVATLGFFWFHEPLDGDERQSGRFWERFANVETKEELRADRKPPLRLQFGKHRVLERADLSRWTLCLVHLMWGAADPGKREISARYLDGLAMIAKSDVHMAFEIQAVAAFYMALLAAMKVYEAVADERFPVALKGFVSAAFKQMDDDGHLDRLIAVGESVNSGKPVPHAMNMNDVHVMKTICDVYLIRAFQKVGLPEGRNRESSEDTTNTQGS